MTLQLDIPNEVASHLATHANERSISQDELACRILMEGLQEIAMDERDAAEARRRMASSNLVERRSLDDWRKAWKQ